MRVVQFDQYGPPEVLHIATMEAPAAGPGQLQLKVAAAGVNPADFKWRSGSLHHLAALKFPHVVGYDVAGIVAAVGPEVHRFKVGDRVVASVASGYSELAVANENACALVPDGFDLFRAAALPCSALTGVQLIEEGIRPQRGQTVLVTGATGAVGRFAVMAAVALGVRVVAAVRPAYFDDARRLGAADVISLDDGGPHGLSFGHVADTVGGPAVAKLCRHVSPRGTILTVATTPIDPEGLPAVPVFFAYHHDGERLARIVADVVRGVIDLPVIRRLSFESAAEAHRLMEAGGIRGKIVLEPSP